MTDTLTPTVPLQTAVLFLVFNRPDVTAQVFEAIRKAKPPRLYIAADGPRVDRAGEAEKVAKVREIATAVDWPCEVKTLFREENLGCKYAVSGGITWFFEHEKQGIILEDDCLPSQSFFWFCEELLEKYKDDKRVWHIAGNNFHFGWRRDEDYSYYFSYYGSIWGWASWSDRWSAYTVNMQGYEEIKAKNYLKDLFGNQKEANFRYENFDHIRRGLDTWDYQWVYTRFVNSGLSIVPSVNLVKNLGFNQNATHTSSENDRRANLNAIEVTGNILHPRFLIRDKKSDDLYFNSFLVSKLEKIMSKIKKNFFGS